MGNRKSKSTRNNGNMLPRLGNGRFDVGYAEIMVRGVENEDDTGILVTIYYPSDGSLTSNEQLGYPLWIPREEYIDGLAYCRNLPSYWMRFVHRMISGKKRIPARWHLALNSTEVNYPVLVFSHGLSGCRYFYSVYCLSLASHGYVVAAVEHRDCSACWTYKFVTDEKTGEKIELPVKFRKLTSTDDEFQLRNGQELNLGQYSSDQQAGKKLLLGNDFQWSQFKDRLDMGNTIIAGHSLGGATAVATAASFPTDFTAAVVLDGWMFPLEKELLTRIQQPVLFINAENFQWEANVKDMLQVIENSKHSVLITINEASHINFTDLQLFIPKILHRWLGIKSSCDAVHCLEAIIELTAHFLKSYYEEPHAAFNLLTYKDIITVGARFTSGKHEISA